jgi:hypothetical protein
MIVNILRYWRPCFESLLGAKSNTGFGEMGGRCDGIDCARNRRGIDKTRLATFEAGGPVSTHVLEALLGHDVYTQLKKQRTLATPKPKNCYGF